MLHKILSVHEFICKVCEIVHFREHCRTFELLLKTICNIRSAKSAMDWYNTCNFCWIKSDPYQTLSSILQNNSVTFRSYFCSYKKHKGVSMNCHFSKLCRHLEIKHQSSAPGRVNNKSDI